MLILTEKDYAADMGLAREHMEEAFRHLAAAHAKLEATGRAVMKAKADRLAAFLNGLYDLRDEIPEPYGVGHEPNDWYFRN